MFTHKISDIVSDRIHHYGDWEIENIELFIQKLRKVKKDNPNKKIAYFDLGANVGWYSFIAAQNDFYVAAFEPLKENIFAIRKTICLNPQWK